MTATVTKTQHQVRIAGKTYDLTIEYDENTGKNTVRVAQFPGIVSSRPDQDRAIDSVITAIIDKISESNQPPPPPPPPQTKA